MLVNNCFWVSYCTKNVILHFLQMTFFENLKCQISQTHPHLRKPASRIWKQKCVSYSKLELVLPAQMKAHGLVAVVPYRSILSSAVPHFIPEA
jgi:hypothetical protein